MAIIYHITTIAEWEKAKEEGSYKAASFATEGFIHCCTTAQAPGVLERYFLGKTGLVALVIDTEKLTALLKYELAPSINEHFPHIYGPINLDAVMGETDPQLLR
jgi:uncharacterized protein (DUF952 family)